MSRAVKANRTDAICFSDFLYKARNLIERFFNKTKQYLLTAIHYDKLAENDLATLKLVSIRIWLSDNESMSKHTRDHAEPPAEGR